MKKTLKASLMMTFLLFNACGLPVPEDIVKNAYNECKVECGDNWPSTLSITEEGGARCLCKAELDAMYPAPAPDCRRCRRCWYKRRPYCIRAELDVL